MKHWLTLVMLFLSSSFTAFSQGEMSRNDDPPKGYLLLTFGPSFINGDFSKNDFFNQPVGFEKNSYPKNGYQYSIAEFGFKFIPSFGLAATLKGAIYPQDVQALADNYAQEFGGQFTVTSSRWGYTGLFVGPFFSIPSKYIDIDFRFQTGLLFAKSPEVIVSRAPEEIVQKSALGASFGLQGGIGTRIHLTQKFGLVLQGEYHISAPVFEPEFYDDSVFVGTEQVSKTISAFNISFGIEYRIF